ncbi:MAG TPA: amidohydrolase family protein [Chloroflexota bacterium]|jgi:predicted TIM-barrel fold metal-dependent hydrolase|nr:amidohydrolase family protein [Chloroflexota bacterium]
MSPATIDAFVFLGQSLLGYGQSEAELLARLDAADVERAVVCPVKPRGYHLAPANDLVAEAAARQQRFVGLARVDPHFEDDALRELDRAVETLGLRGLFLHPWEETFRVNDPRVDPLLRRCADLDVPVLIATGYPWLSEAAQVGDLARRFPSVPIVMTHGGQINISGLGQADAFDVLRRYPNVNIETSGVYRQDFLLDVATDLGAERVLFGSNSPRMDMRLEVQRARWADLPEAARALILGNNAWRVFRLDAQRASEPQR